MRFLEGGPIIPDTLLEARDAGNVVFLCGAGISIPAGMPTFYDLAKYVIDLLNPSPSSESFQAFEPWRIGSAGAKRSLDDVFNLLVQDFGREPVIRLVAERLTPIVHSECPSRNHEIVSRLSADQTGRPQIVTTNFDCLFDGVDLKHKVQSFTPPTFPDLKRGASFSGIAYLHGKLATLGSNQGELILTSSDFGRAYLRDSWAPEFVKGLLQAHTVVLLGYQAEDPPMKYLLQGLNDAQADRSRLFAFDRGLPDDIVSKWRDRPITPLAYPGVGPDHSALWDTLALWAERADNPRAWKSNVVDLARRGPRDLRAHERGMVAHLVRSPSGAKLLSQAEPPITPEWICVFDAHCRVGKPSRSYGQEAETFDPLDVYGLDDDPPRQSEGKVPVGQNFDDLVEWRAGDENPPELHRLRGRFVAGREPLPTRLSSLANWITRTADSPIVAWWASRWYGIHPGLVRSLSSTFRHHKTLDQKARSVWNTILEYLERGNTSDEDMEWFPLRDRILQEGWNTSVHRSFRKVMEPRLTLSRPYGLAEAMPPLGTWSEVRAESIFRAEIHYPSQLGEPVEIPDEALVEAYASIQQNLIRAVYMMSELEVRWVTVPSCYPDAEADGAHRDGLDSYFIWFTELFNRLARLRPKLARAHVVTWPDGRSIIFDKLRLFAWNQQGVFDAIEVANSLLSLDDAVFWDSGHVRELLFVLRDLWAGFLPEQREGLLARIFAGPRRQSYQSEADHEASGRRIAAEYAAWLAENGCDFPAAANEKFSQMKASLENEGEFLGGNLAAVSESRMHWIGTDENPEVLMGLSVSEIAAAAQAASKRDWGSHTDQRPFLGLIKMTPRKALASLSYSGKRGEFPAGLWMTLLDSWPTSTRERLICVTCRRMLHLPPAVIAEMKYSIGPWLRDHLPSVYELSPSLAFSVFDHFVSGLVSLNSNNTKSALGDVSVGGVVVERSRRTLDHAINGPIGNAMEGLYSVLSKSDRAEQSEIPAEFKTRIERLLAAPGEGSDHAVCILSRHASWLNHIDPDWTSSRILPWFNLAHPSAEPAWNGLLWRHQLPSPPVWAAVKPHFLELFPQIYKWGWGDDAYHQAHEWAVVSCVLRPTEYGGLSVDQARDVIRKMSEDGRRRIIWLLGRIGGANEDGWSKFVVPFISSAWPRDAVLKTEQLSTAWLLMLNQSGDAFPVVLGAVREFLIPIRAGNHWLWEFTQTDNDERALSKRFPSEVLDLLKAIVPMEPSHVPFGLSPLLDQIREAVPDLEADRHFRMLANLAGQR
jgi:NAD-dependent SIR2 family protein deacetylase